MTTQELVERLQSWAVDFDGQSETVDGGLHRHIFQLRAQVARAAASRLSEMDAEIKRLREALQYVDDCFNAAMFEGWIDAKENGDVERIRDLWQRRISYAWSNTLNVLQDRAALEHQQKGEGL